LNWILSFESVIFSDQLLKIKSLACIVVRYHESFVFLSSSRNEFVENVAWISQVSNEGWISGRVISQLVHIVTCNGVTFNVTNEVSDHEKVWLMNSQKNIDIENNKEKVNQIFFILFFINYPCINYVYEHISMI